MKHKKFAHSLLVSACLAAASALTAHAQAQTAPASMFNVQQVELSGQANWLSEATRRELLAELRRGGPRSLSEQDLARLVQGAQAWLDAKLPQRFVLRIPAQTLSSGTLSVQVQPRLTSLSITGATDFDQANVRASLPSLVQGKPLESGQWVDLRELQMANENPLKLTTVDYVVQPDQGVRAEVKAMAPNGKTQWTVGLSNAGNDISGRNQVQLNAVNGNLTGQDDVLGFAAGSSLENVGDTAFLALRYTLPDYAKHLSRSFELTHSKGNATIPFLSFATIGSQGNYSELGYRQTHYLGDLAGQINSAKLAFGLSYIASDAQTQFLGSTLQQYDIKTVPLTLTFESDFKVEPQNQSHLRLDWLGSSAAVAGKSEDLNWRAARSDVNNRYNIFRLGLNGRMDLNSLATFSWLYRGQYSAQKLLPSLQFSAANVFTGVRGFVNASAQGDTGQVLRLELESANVPLLSRLALRSFGFYDTGTKAGGNDERNIKLSSYGLGLRLSTPDRRLKLETFAATKDTGRDLDLNANRSAQMDKTSFWFLANYTF
jgi:hemolysin activation/secretion protein